MAELLKNLRLVSKKWFDLCDLPEGDRDEQGTVLADDALAGKVSETNEI